jgi:hypothetical protein
MESKSVCATVAYPVAFFKSVTNTTPQNTAMTWQALQRILKDQSAEPYQKKSDAPLFSPTNFNGKRAAANATEAGLIVLDADHGLAFDDAVAALRTVGLTAIIYTTASHRRDGKGDRFRIVVPLTDSVDVQTHKKIGLILAKLVGGEQWQPDMGKLGCYNLFYLPGQYEVIENRLEYLEGDILSADDYLSLVADDNSEHISVPRKAKHWTGLDDCPFVRPDWVNDYLFLPGNWYGGLYRFMCRVATRAYTAGVELLDTDLAELARELDRRDGSHYQGNGTRSRDFEAEARNALSFATRVASNRTASPNNSGQLEFGEGEQGSPLPVPALLPRPLPHPAAKPYDFADQAFAGRDGATRNPTFEYLAERCIAIGDAYYVRSGTGWTHHRRSTVVAALLQQHGTTKVGSQEISDFLKYGIVTFMGTTVLPGSPLMVTVNDERLLNHWQDTRLPGANEHADHAEIILRLIWENLCDLPPATMDEMYDVAMGAQPHLFRYVLHWLASIYQRPGHQIGTVLWFVGPNMGVGKGTLVAIMAALLGPRWVGKANASEFGRGWTDFLAGRLLLECDEFETGSRSDLNRFFKMYVGDDVVSVAKRHVGSYQIPNVFNFIATTNKLHPIQLERDDRRHTLIHTTDDRSRNTLAVEFNSLSETARSEALQGFAAILGAIKIDSAMIRKPFPTALRTDIISYSMDAIERWFALTDARWAVGETLTATEAYGRFVTWADQADPRALTQVSNPILFGREMSKLESTKFVMRKKSSTIAYTKTAYHDPMTAHIIAEHPSSLASPESRAAWILAQISAKHDERKEVFVGDIHKNIDKSIGIF